MSGSFRISVWDPALILSQIVALQSIMYVSLGLFVVVLLHMIAGHPISIDYIFKHQWTFAIDFLYKHNIIILLKSPSSAASLWAIVQRTKLCLDFSATAHLLHLAASLIYNSAWPSSASWWVLQFSCATVTCVLGEFLCLRSEMKSIPLGMSARVDL
uniref:EOG090X0FH3 n=1 Tax=Alona affinis TaxID=381656 RepID=A0A9N6ZDS5_9CRUS|nr:EOG090X0FH3 [Alona affinis]